MVALQKKEKEQTERSYLRMQQPTQNQELEQLKKLRLNTEKRG